MPWGPHPDDADLQTPNAAKAFAKPSGEEGKDPLDLSRISPTPPPCARVQAQPRGAAGADIDLG